jgi:hypothetical protein
MRRLVSTVISLGIIARSGRGWPSKSDSLSILIHVGPPTLPYVPCQRAARLLVMFYETHWPPKDCVKACLLIQLHYYAVNFRANDSWACNEIAAASSDAETGDGFRTYTWIIIGVLGGVLVVGTTIVVAIFVYRRIVDNKNNNNSIDGRILDNLLS